MSSAEGFMEVDWNDTWQQGFDNAIGMGHGKTWLVDLKSVCVLCQAAELVIGDWRLGEKNLGPFLWQHLGWKPSKLWQLTKVLFPFSSLLNICDRPGGFDVQSFELCGDDGRSGLFSPPPCASFHQATSQPSERKTDHRRRILWRHAAAAQTVTHTRVWLWTQADTHRHKHTCQHHL